MKISKVAQSIQIIERSQTEDISRQIVVLLSRQAEATPYLLEILNKVRANPSDYAGRPEYTGHIYSLLLLGQYQEVRSHQLIVDLFSLPPPLPAQLFGDIITEYLPLLLYRTGAGSLAQVKTLILK